MLPSRRRLSPPAEALRAGLEGLQAENRSAWQAFLWLAVLSKDAIIAAPAAATLWGVSDAQADSLLEELSGRTLLQPDGPQTAGGRVWRGYRMPAELRAVAGRLLALRPPTGLGLSLARASAALLDRYRARTRGGAWHTLDDDGYIHAHLAAHLAQASRLDDLDALLKEETSGGRNGWYEARRRLGQLDGYLADVRLAWRAALRRQPAGVPEPSGAVSLECRYALIVASLNSLASGGPAGPPGESSAHEGAVGDGQPCAEAILGLGPYLPDEMLGEALAAARTIEPWCHREEGLIALGPRLPPPLLSEAWTVSRAWEGGYEFEQVLGGLGPYLPADLRAQVLREALAKERVSDYGRRSAGGLARLIRFLPPPQQERVAAEALAALRAVYDEGSRRGILGMLAPNLPAELKPKALAVVLRFKDEFHRACALADLAPCLSPDLLGEALDGALALAEPIWCAHALEGLGPYLEAQQACRALATARAIEYAWSRSKALSALATNLPADLKANVLGEALASARAIEEPCHRAFRLADLVERLPREQREAVQREALGAVRAGVRPPPRRRKLPPGVMVCLRLPPAESWCAIAVKVLAPYLPGELMSEALGAAQSLGEETCRADALGWLAPYLPADLMGEALIAVRDIDDGRSRSQTLIALAPHLPASLMREALKEACSPQTRRPQRSAEDGSDGSLPPELVKKLRASEHDFRRESALAGLAPHLPENLLGRALAAACAIAGERQRSRALAAFTRRLAALAPSHLLPLWRSALTALSRRTRADLLSDLSALGPVIAALGGEQAVGETVRAIQDVGRWWP